MDNPTGTEYRRFHTAMGKAGEELNQQFRQRYKDLSLGMQDTWGWFQHLGTTEHAAHEAVVFTDWNSEFLSLLTAAETASNMDNVAVDASSDVSQAARGAAQPPTAVALVASPRVGVHGRAIFAKFGCLKLQYKSRACPNGTQHFFSVHGCSN